ncbi:M56 family metallopeptidase [Paenibacillus sp. PL91]|uniref:M56 family metallopeptidase n=1 Tax=Paenibacillus sp. PL91 TaxID=2729538 RepID=UPI00145D3224|nr:M56 family metallopeptidase [Paenibacillus sp. PL91]MBC9199340.1 M56 family metallopeptidase [Paenibacillus sp. PL91]
MRWQRKSSLVLALSLFIALLVWSQMGMYIVHLIFGVNVKVNFFKFCISLFKENTLYYFIVITFLNSLIAYAILITLIKVIQQYVLSRRFKIRLMSLRNIHLTAKIIQQFQPINQNIIVIDHGHAMAFTVGFRRPLIVLSSELIEMLDQRELEAVIEHESFHQSHNDSLKIFILQLISQSLWFIPITKWTYHNFKLMSELLADEHAIKKTGTELGLGGALLKLIKKGFKDNPTPVLVYFTDGVVNYRLQQLVDPDHDIPVRLGKTSIVISIHVLLLFMGMIVLAIT